MLFSDKDISGPPLIPCQDIDGMLRLVFCICDAMMLVVDQSGRLCLVNETALNILGYEENDLNGQPFARLIDDRHKNEIKRLMQSCGSTAEAFDNIFFLTREKKTVIVETKMIRVTVKARDYIFITGKDVSQIRATEDKFYKAFHSSSVVMVVFTVDEGRIIDANESAFRLTGYTAGEMIGSTIVDLNLYPDRKQRLKIQQVIREKGCIESHEIMMRSKAGETCYVIFSMDVLTIDSEACVLAVGSDFTQRKQAEQALQKAYAEQGRQKDIIQKKSSELEKAKQMIEHEARLVEESSRHKTEFLASMSHELRTPLNSIILLSELLARNSGGKLTDKEVEYAGIIRSAGKDLLGLINDILDISRVEAGRMDVSLSQVSVEYFSRKISGYFTEMAAVKGLSFEVCSETGLTGSFVTDIQKLEQIVRNLVSNAIKFTEKGYVRLLIHRPDGSDDLSMIGMSGLDHEKALAFSVEDSGIGVPAEKLDCIFEQYRQADADIVKKYGGTGLGLPVSRVLAQLLGGDICVRSVFGQGSTFTLFIPERMMAGVPRRPDVKPEPLAVKPREIDAKLGRCLVGKTLMIADDDMRTVYSLIQNLQGHGPEILVAGDGEKCMSRLKEKAMIDLLLLDIVMPGLNGLEILRKIRKNRRLKNLPVIVISARAMDRDRNTALSAGADAYLSKPLDMDALLGTAVRLLSD